MSQKELTKAQLCDRFGESAKQIERYVAEGLPCAGTGRARRFPWPEAMRWRDERVKRLERDATEKRLTPATADAVQQANNRRRIAEARLIEIELAEREGLLVTTAHVEQVVSELGDRLRAALINLPANHLLDLERVGVDPARAQAVLEQIAEALTRTLRAAADDLEAVEDDEPLPA